jgi:Carboxypeptidase regulatory-like domain/TonB-dependent Receptor Plug Domain/TonB dependent receptor
MFCARRRVACLLGFLVFTCAASAWTQVSRGTITGIVTDPSGAVVPGVTITVVNTATGVTNKVNTNSSGNYVVPLLQPGTYSVTAAKKGFRTYSRTNIILPVGETVRLDVAMTLGATTQTVQVTAAPPLLKRDTSDLSTTITTQEVEDLPLTSFGDQRQPADFLQLAPGVTGQGPSNNNNEGYSRTMSTSVSGSAVSSTTMMLDGADIPTPGGFEGDLRALQIPPDAIQEFSLEQIMAPAEYGRSGGGVASFVVKSGTNQIHGTAYEFLRNDGLNARSFFEPAVTPYKQNEFGVTGGGPIKKNKAFIFGWYDGFRLSEGVSTAEATVPTVAMKNGDFTDYGTTNAAGQFVQTPLYDPTTQTTCGPEICNNIVNPDDISSVAAKINPLFPNPTNTSPFAVVNNYVSSVANPETINEWGLKGDYVVNERNRLSVEYDYGNNTSPNVAEIPPPLGGGSQPSYNKSRQARINYNLTLAPNLINEATLGFNFWGGGSVTLLSYAGRSDWDQYLGLKGFTPDPPDYFPQIVIDGLSYNGGPGISFGDQHESQVNDSLTWIKGEHTAKFGFNYMKGASNNVGTSRTGGYFCFQPYETGLASNSVSGAGFASYLLGLANDVQDYNFTTPGYDRNSYWGLFAQDDYKVSKKLTLNLGLRWEVFTPDVHKNNTKSWVSPTLPNPAAGNLPGALQFATAWDPSGVNTYYRDFGPRIGLAYALNDKTVIRAGYGIFYSQGNGSLFDSTNYVQGYNGTEQLTSPNGGVTPAFNWDTDTMPHYTLSLTPSALLGEGLYMLEPQDGLAPYMENYTFDVERQLPGQTMLSVAYVGNKGTHLASVLMPTNQMPPQFLPLGSVMINGTSELFTPISNPTVQALPVVAKMPVDPATMDHSPFAGFQSLWGASATLGQALRLFPQYNNLTNSYEGVGVSNYQALQIKADKRFSNGLTLLVSYAWSKTLTDGGSLNSVFSSQFGSDDVWNAKTQYTYSFNDLPNVASIAYVYDLPVGQGKRFLNRGGVINQVVGGWSVSGIQQYRSGQPQNVEVPPGWGNLEGADGFNTPNQVNGVPMASAAYKSGHFNPAVDSMFNPAAFSIPCAFCVGTLTPTEAAVRNFPYLDEDFSLMKRWNLTERMNLNFRADFFNAFNRVVFGSSGGDDNAYAAEPVFGEPGFGMVSAQINYPRTIQFGLRLNY